MAISTRDLSTMPDIPSLERLTQSLAMLDAIISPEWEYRYFSFNANWDPSLGERMASMRNGSGNEYFLLFASAGAILKGFDHESPMSPWIDAQNAVWPGVLDQVPEGFAAFLTEPAFNLKDTTFCIWRTGSDSVWRCGSISFPEGSDPDGSEGLLWAFDGNPATYAEFAREYYEMNPADGAIEKIYSHQPLTAELVAALNPDKDVAESLRDAEEIGYGFKRGAA
jgi:hypothetical protein